MAKRYKLHLLLIALLALFYSCGSVYERKIKHSNIAGIVHLIEDNYPAAPNSPIEIPFYYSDSSHVLGDPNLYDYSAERATALGKYSIPTDVAQQVADFCREYRIGNIVMKYVPAADGGSNLVIVLEKQPEGFPYKNHTIYYSKNGNFEFLSYPNWKDINKNIIIVRKPGNIM